MLQLYSHLGCYKHVLIYRLDTVAMVFAVSKVLDGQSEQSGTLLSAPHSCPIFLSDYSDFWRSSILSLPACSNVVVEFLN